MSDRTEPQDDDDDDVPFVALDIDPKASWEDIVEMLNLKPARTGEPS